jgi:non-haem Fe2+, alpha-ketoglutarate-dependent halogenase
MNNRALTREQIQQYETTGVVFPITVISSGELNYFQDAFNRIETLACGRLKHAGHLHLFFPWAWELATLPRSLDAAEDLLGPDLVIDSTLLLCKYPHDPAFVPWHQDGLYSAWYTTPSVSAWIALSDATPENGCMRVIPGSHRQGRIPHSETDAQDSLFGRTEEIQVEVEEDQARWVTLAAGEGSFHHSSIVHGSPPNRSDTKRISMIVRFVTPLFQHRKATSPVVQARGNRDLGSLQPVERPPSGDIEECFSRWQAFVSGTPRLRRDVVTK